MTQKAILDGKDRERFEEMIGYIRQLRFYRYAPWIIAIVVAVLVCLTIGMMPKERLSTMEVVFNVLIFTPFASCAALFVSRVLAGRFAKGVVHAFARTRALDDGRRIIDDLRTYLKEVVDLDEAVDGKRRVWLAPGYAVPLSLLEELVR